MQAGQAGQAGHACRVYGPRQSGFEEAVGAADSPLPKVVILTLAVLTLSVLTVLTLPNAFYHYSRRKKSSYLFGGGWNLKT